MVVASPSEPRSQCAFCRIVDRTDDAEIVADSDASVMFLDRWPLFHGHLLVVPRVHVVTLADLPADHVGPFFADVQRASATLPAAMGAAGTFVANNNVVSQSVAHLHVHVVPRTKGDGLRGFFWPRTTYGPGEMEVTARLVRAAFATAYGK